jgi:tetratricopeptide (TPR) repeat protein
VSGGGGRPSGVHYSAPRVSSGVIHSSSFAPARVSSSGIRAATIDPVATSRSVHTFAAYEGEHNHHHHGTRSSDFFFFGIGAPFGFYGGLSYYPGLYQDGFQYSPYGIEGQPGYPGPVPQQTPPVPPVPNPNQLSIAEQGLLNFDMKKYPEAAQNWRQAIAEDSRNPRLILLFAQALFQSGQFDEAAGAVQYALTIAPQKEWNGIAPRFGELYRDNIFDYSNRLRELEKARTQKKDDPALRFLLGYHYASLGYTDEAVRELTQVEKIAPKDDVARQLREMMEAKRK